MAGQMERVSNLVYRVYGGLKLETPESRVRRAFLHLQISMSYSLPPMTSWHTEAKSMGV